MPWWESITPVVVARAVGLRGEVVLRRREEPGRSIDELVVNGAFAMDSQQVSSKEALGGLAGRPGTRDVLVGGLGLGYTAAAVAAHPARRIDVVEVEPCLVEWARRGLTPTWRAVASDARIALHVADVADVVRTGLANRPTPADGPSGSIPDRWDLILLDVDNGPDFLIHDHNAPLYADDLLHRAARRLRPGGRLAVWCQGPSPALAAALRRAGGTVEAQPHPIRRGERAFTYVVYVLTVGDVPPEQPAPASGGR